MGACFSAERRRCQIAPRREDLERLFIAAHTLKGTSASYGFPRFSEIAGKLAHVFQYALNAPLGDDLHGPITEFLSDGISLLETSLIEISDTGQENREDISAFKERYRFAFPPEPPPLNLSMTEPQLEIASAAPEADPLQTGLTGSYFDALPSDDEVPDEILEFFQPEAEEHLQIVSDCLLSLEGNNNPEEINRLATDAIADLLWTPSPDADANLRAEGVPAEKIDCIGNIMIDSFEMLR